MVLGVTHGCEILSVPSPNLSITSGVVQVRVPTNVVSSICDDRGEEPTYNGVDMSTLIQGNNGVADVISLLWFKRSLPKYATRFIEMCIMLCADHGPCVSGKPVPQPSSPCLLASVCMGVSRRPGRAMQARLLVQQPSYQPGSRECQVLNAMTACASDDKIYGEGDMSRENCT